MVLWADERAWRETQDSQVLALHRPQTPSPQVLPESEPSLVQAHQEDLRLTIALRPAASLLLVARTTLPPPSWLSEQPAQRGTGQQRARTVECAEAGKPRRERAVDEARSSNIPELMAALRSLSIDATQVAYRGRMATIHQSFSGGACCVTGAPTHQNPGGGDRSMLPFFDVCALPGAI